MPAERAMRRAECVLAGETSQVRAARRFVTSLVGDGWLDDGDVALLTGELAANAVTHSASGQQPGGKFIVRVIVIRRHYLLVEVEDQGGPWPGPGESDEAGRGLGIVGSIASEWGRAGNAATGWIVWARMDWPPRTPGPDRTPGPAVPNGAVVRPRLPLVPERDVTSRLVGQ